MPRRKKKSITVDRGEVGQVLDRIVSDDPRTQIEIAGLAGLTARHLRNAMYRDYPDKAVQVLRALGYEVTETITIKEG